MWHDAKALGHRRLAQKRGIVPSCQHTHRGHGFRHVSTLRIVARQWRDLLCGHVQWPQWRCSRYRSPRGRTAGYSSAPPSQAGPHTAPLFTVTERCSRCSKAAARSRPSPTSTRQTWPTPSRGAEKVSAGGSCERVSRAAMVSVEAYPGVDPGPAHPEQRSRRDE